jgi:AcrR family transcriptional regulator
VTDERRYHHGDLPAALLTAVHEVVRERGQGAITLREVARRAGVSHAAPAHHFGDKAGLLTAYAVQGFDELRARLERARDDAAAMGVQPLASIGLAYVGFAVEEPERFGVMFRPEHLHSDTGYRTACDGAFQVLVAAVRGIRPDLDPRDPEVMLAATGAWSVVHGFATLWLDGNLDDSITALTPEEATAAPLTAFGATLFAAAGVAGPDPHHVTPQRYLDASRPSDPEPGPADRPA